MSLPLLSPKLDLVFKRLFVLEPELLLDLLNQVLGCHGYRSLRTIEVRNPEIPPDAVHAKLIVLDIHAEDDLGRDFDVEMQSQSHSIYAARSIFYLAKLYAQQLDRGEDYRELRSVLGVHFLNFRLFPKHDGGQHCFEWRERTDPTLRLSDQMALFLFELPKLGVQTDTPMNQWLHFFNHAAGADDSMSYSHPPVQQALKTLRRISVDDRERQLADMREKALRDETTLLRIAEEEGLQKGLERGLKQGLEKGLEQGRTQGRKEGEEAGRLRERQSIALGLMDLLDDKTIAARTGLTVEAVSALRSGSGSRANGG